MDLTQSRDGHQLPGLDEEWLVTDGRGAFAQGTAAGVRSRKYHGFFQTIAGRSERAAIGALDLRVNVPGGLSDDSWRPLLPHLYLSNDGPVCFPDPKSLSDLGFSFDSQPAPTWSWHFPEGQLRLVIAPPPQSARAQRESGIGWHLSWLPQAGVGDPSLRLQLRPLGAFRPLHGMGGHRWNWHEGAEEGLSVLRADGAQAPAVFARAVQGGRARGHFVQNESWYYRFHYALEKERGYDFEEDLHSPGYFAIEFDDAGEFGIWIGEDPATLPKKTLKALKLSERKPPIADFVLREPAGIVAGYPWFGEWGRDTFVSLPGMVAALERIEGTPSARVRKWAREVIARWGGFIESEGMLPNLVESPDRLQWETADATLWWAHSLAALWSRDLAEGRKVEAGEWSRNFGRWLERVIVGITQGRHRFLRVDQQGMLEVEEGHATWMDARLHGNAVTPRGGRLPEINALWVQAQALAWMWSAKGAVRERERIRELAGRVSALGVSEPLRPNRIFLHSLPLAPSFLAGKRDLLARDLGEIAGALWTPVGLRSLSPESPDFKPRCAGTQEARDLAYHQGTVWAWLGGHYEIARARLERPTDYPEFSLPETGAGPIRGHVAEIFDAIEPFAARGAPAQAWSLACLEESRSRVARPVDGALLELWPRGPEQSTGAERMSRVSL